MRSPDGSAYADVSGGERERGVWVREMSERLERKTEKSERKREKESLFFIFFLFF